MVGIDSMEDIEINMSTLEHDSDVDVVGLSSEEDFEISLNAGLDRMSGNLRKVSKFSVCGFLKRSLTVMCCYLCVINLFVLFSLLYSSFRYV